MNNIGYLIHLSSKLLKNDLNKKLESENFTATQWAVIKDLQLAEYRNAPSEHFTAASIAKRLDMDKPTMSGVVNRLYEKDFIKKVENPTDKRSYLIQLTNKSRRSLESLQSISDETIEVALNGFERDEAELLTCYLQRIILNLKG